MGKNNSDTEHINKSMNENVAEKKAKATLAKAKKEFEAKTHLVYIANDSYLSDPFSLLGKVIYEEKDSDKMNSHIIDVEVKPDQSSILKTPITRQELIIDNKISAELEVLSYVSGTLVCTPKTGMTKYTGFRRITI